MFKRLIAVLLTGLVLCSCSDHGHYHKVSGKEVTLPSKEVAVATIDYRNSYSRLYNDVKEIGPDLKKGDIIALGEYEQDGDLSDGKEKILWEVLEVKGSKALVLSYYVMDMIPYNMEKTSISWADCSLRTWLNDTFLQNSFSESDKAKIIDTLNSNEVNMLHGTSGGDDTLDKVFILQVEDLMRYYEFGIWDEEQYSGYSEDLLACPTEYAKQQGVYVCVADDEYYMANLKRFGYTEACKGMELSGYLTRSTGVLRNYICFVSYFGRSGYKFSQYVDETECGIRPAMYIDISGGSTDA
ncbi:MAG: DUF6273 domain-containing protein [Lachnospiraceae bacterium]|nr:DUF6273 domain-containing protein [Lachnospiraceae bacterium]